MRILGIDPGLATMGWGVIDAEGSALSLVACGALTTPPDMRSPVRLWTLEAGVRDLLSAYQPNEIVFEELFFARNVTTALQVGAARGAALVACAGRGDVLYEYTPMQIKQAVVGYGRADKHQVQQMVKLLLHMDDIIRPDDAADAVAAAITHASAGRQRAQFLMK